MEEISWASIALLVGLITLSAYFSSSETAFSSVNRVRMQHYRDEKRPGSRLALQIIDNYDTALSAILIGNNLVNIAATSITTQLATSLIPGSAGIFVSTAVMTVVILIFGEVLPKSLAKENAEAFCLRTSGILHGIMVILKPITGLFVMLKNAVSRIFQSKDATPTVTEEELKVMFRLGEEEGVIENHEKQLLDRTLDFNDILVGEVLTPRIDVIAIDANSDAEEILGIFLRERYSRVPVYEESVDQIVGILSERDFLAAYVAHKRVNVRELMREPLFVVESMRIATLLPELQRRKVHMAVVVDEFGGTSGIVTIEDIIEELVGEIWDEHDERIQHITQVAPERWMVLGETGLQHFWEVFGDTNEESEYNTVSGWVTELFQRIPEVGEQITYKNLALTVEEVDDRRIKRVSIIVKETENTD
ncbi:MAG: hemolysin family protein [Bacilli bacterium]